MNDTLKPTNADASGYRRLEAYQIATLPICLRDGKHVDIEHASDEEFQAFVVSSGIPVKSHGVVEWSFSDRCRFIDYALRRGISLSFVPVEGNSPAILSEFFSIPDVAQEANPD